MDYEKKYKKALDRAKRLHSEPTGGTERIICEQIFPELAESEDEKIRKELIEHIKANSATGFVLFQKFSPDDVIAWLENRGEPSIKWNKNTEGNKPQINRSVLMKTIYGIAEGEWKGEHWLQYRWSGSLKDSDVLSWIELSNLEKQGEQILANSAKTCKDEKKPAEWSEEDEKVVANLVDYFKIDDALQYTEKQVVEWLKSLKQRIGG